jgi:hypothetical protein
MARTPYQKENGDYSNKVHELAQRIIYPELFRAQESDIDYEEDTLLEESERGAILDGEMAIDRIVKVKVKGLNGSIPFTIQERFRRPRYANFRDITITEWNHRSNLPSELYKIRANIFLYGYANHEETPNGFVEAVAIDTTQLLIKIARQEIKHKMQSNDKGQTFVTCAFEDLTKAGAVLWHKRDLNDPLQAYFKMKEKYPREWIVELVNVASSELSTTQA